MDDVKHYKDVVCAVRVCDRANEMWKGGERVRRMGRNEWPHKIFGKIPLNPSGEEYSIRFAIKSV